MDLVTFSRFRAASMRSSPRRRAAQRRNFVARGWRVWLGSVLVTVLVAAPLLAIVHQASEGHAVCEHGALIETGHVGAHQPADPASSSSETPEFQADPGALHDHVHCTVATLAKASATVVPPVGTVTAELEIARVHSFDVEPRSERAVLENAPKTSPPETSAQRLTV
jgi:hypothetical protein